MRSASSLFHFCPSSLLRHLTGQKVMSQVQENAFHPRRRQDGSWLSAWRSPRHGVHLWSTRAGGGWFSCLSLPLCRSAFQINKCFLKSKEMRESSIIWLKSYPVKLNLATSRIFSPVWETIYFHPTIYCFLFMNIELFNIIIAFKWFILPSIAHIYQPFPKCTTVYLKVLSSFKNIMYYIIYPHNI